MLSSSIPSKFGTTFASGAGPGFVTPQIPDAPQSAGHASMTEGFPPLTFQQIAAGGSPPWGADMNGLMKQVSAWLQWQAAGNAGVFYDASFSTKIGGYPKGAMLQKLSTQDRFWISTADNNPTDPDAGGANWIPFPDVIVQQQKGNYAIDVGIVNAFEITLDPLPASLASIVGSPIRVRAANANASTTPTILIHNAAGDLALPMINGNGTPLIVNQIARASQIFEGFVDGLGNFQLAWPQPIPGTPSQQFWAPGQIIIWPTEIAPLGTLECDGRSLLIASYPNLFAVIGRIYGGDADHFNIPDYRGYFHRGWDHGRGVDVGAGSRTNRGDGLTGDHVGTKEAASINPSQANSSIHISSLLFGGPINDGGNVQPGDPKYDGQIWRFVSELLAGGNDSYARPLQGTVGAGWLHPTDLYGTMIFPNQSETRPININVMYCIAY